MVATMMAVRTHAHGGPQTLVYESVPRPQPKRGEVLVEVHAAGLNPPDWYARAGFTNLPADLLAMVPKIPMPFIPGTDVSGVVVGLGPESQGWAIGDEVFGLLRFPSADAKAYAQYTTAPVTDLARKPAGLDHVHAAGLPMSGLTAYQYLFDTVNLKPGSTVLVNGAAGGVGHVAVQLAKTTQSYVIGLASGRHEAFLRDLGVDRFIDYTRTTLDQMVRDLDAAVDVVLDTVGGPHGHRFLPLLRRGGQIAPVFYGEYHRELAAERGIAIKDARVRSSGTQLAELARLVDANQLRIGIDSVFPLAEASQAHERAERGHIQGKIVLQVIDGA